ncbi:hypothetical protein HK096_007257 [Nowakowskiella sp. JEL0078]|nr:hypothetical protein HK096_007257 [Nowakowskiella sp. JEL0078]
MNDILIPNELLNLQIAIWSTRLTSIIVGIAVSILVGFITYRYNDLAILEVYRAGAFPAIMAWKRSRHRNFFKYVFIPLLSLIPLLDSLLALGISVSPARFDAASFNISYNPLQMPLYVTKLPDLTNMDSSSWNTALGGIVQSVGGASGANMSFPDTITDLGNYARRIKPQFSCSSAEYCFLNHSDILGSMEIYIVEAAKGTNSTFNLGGVNGTMSIRVTGLSSGNYEDLDDMRRKGQYDWHSPNLLFMDTIRLFGGSNIGTTGNGTSITLWQVRQSAPNETKFTIRNTALASIYSQITLPRANRQNISIIIQSCAEQFGYINEMVQIASVLPREFNFLNSNDVISFLLFNGEYLVDFSITQSNRYIACQIRSILGYKTEDSTYPTLNFHLTGNSGDQSPQLWSQSRVGLVFPVSYNNATWVTRATEFQSETKLSLSEAIKFLDKSPFIALVAGNSVLWSKVDLTKVFVVIRLWVIICATVLVGLSLVVIIVLSFLTPQQYSLLISEVLMAVNDPTDQRSEDYNSEESQTQKKLLMTVNNPTDKKSEDSDSEEIQSQKKIQVGQGIAKIGFQGYSRSVSGLRVTLNGKLL